MGKKIKLINKDNVDDTYYGPIARNAKIRAFRDRLVEKGIRIKYFVSKKKKA